jgi:predicted DCC family thiol-disulfide oxidoreductase YuxK
LLHALSTTLKFAGFAGRARHYNSVPNDRSRKGAEMASANVLAPVQDKTAEVQDHPFEIEVFYDGDCPLCRREINLLKRLDRRQAIRFTDIAAPAFDPAPLGTDYAALMDQIHGRLPDGTMLVGVEVFRRLYASVGFRRLVALTRLPVVSTLLDWSYRLFAKNRLRFTGRCKVDANGRVMCST